MAYAKKNLCTAFSFLMFSTTFSFADTVSWVDWTSVGTAGTVEGEISTTDGTISVDYSNSAGSIAGAQTDGGTDYWANGFFGSTRDASTSAYTNTGDNAVDNIPTGTDIIRLSPAATHTLTFGSPIEDVYLSYVSINGNTLSFDTEVLLLSNGNMNIDGSGVDDCGYWGCGTASITSSLGEFELVASGEAHGTIFIPGTFSVLNFTTSASENWHGFTIGVAGPGGPAPIPLPAAGWLLAGALGGLTAFRRRRH